MRHLPKSALLLLSAALLSACAPKGIEGLKTFEHPGGDVRSGSLTYAQRPPAGGPHNALWQTCGVYDGPLYDEYAVATLARGAIWVTYRADLPAEQRATLREVVKDTPKLLFSPYPGQASPIVLTAWNAQLALADAGDARLAAFLKAYAGGETAPLQGAPCRGGFGGTR